MIYSFESSIYHFCVCTSDSRPYELYGTGHVASLSDLLCVVSTVGILARGYVLKDTPYRALRSRLHQEKRRKSQQRWDLYATLRFRPYFGDITLWNILASCTVIL